MGYLRADGRAATRNEIWVLPTVGCVARTAAKIAEAADRRHRGRVDGVHAFTHPFGCSQLGDDLDGTRALLAALASHPTDGGENGRASWRDKVCQYGWSSVGAVG